MEIFTLVSTSWIIATYCIFYNILKRIVRSMVSKSCWIQEIVPLLRYVIAAINYQFITSYHTNYTNEKFNTYYFEWCILGPRFATSYNRQAGHDFPGMSYFMNIYDNILFRQLTQFWYVAWIFRSIINCLNSASRIAWLYCQPFRCGSENRFRNFLSIETMCGQYIFITYS